MKYELAEKQLYEMQKRFTYHAPKNGQPTRYVEIRETYLAVALGLCQNCPESRELSLALTKLEESVMWANAAIARNE
uniref:Acb2/Tad1 hairpin domain-containing protein n=1 Tax=viral metagenome TaxID=1070528 RepID=A0A6M3KCJ1_9ZZZZ